VDPQLRPILRASKGCVALQGLGTARIVPMR
jgi:hypothetical protein